jgi:hypothetical protein
MRIVGRGPVLALVAFVLTTAAGEAAAGNNPNGVVFRAVGWFKGKGEITAGEIKCEIPSVSTAIAEGAFALGMWNTYGVPTIYYPDINSPFGNPCGVWIMLQNNARDQGLVIDRIRLRYRIPRAGRMRALVPTRNRWPIACRDFRNEIVFAGTRINPVNSSEETQSGAPNVAFIEMLPFVTPQLIGCLRSQYAPLSTDVFVSLPLVVRATAFATSDAGDTYQSNTIQYTLNLRHTCGNGRVDDGEFCDPQAPNTCGGVCQNGVCSQNENLPCTDSSDCAGTCMAQGDPSECICVY